MAGGMTADCCNSVTSAPAFRLQAIDSLTGRASIDGCRDGGAPRPREEDVHPSSTGIGPVVPLHLPDDLRLEPVDEFTAGFMCRLHVLTLPCVPHRARPRSGA